MRCINKLYLSSHGRDFPGDNALSGGGWGLGTRCPGDGTHETNDPWTVTLTDLLFVQELAQVPCGLNLFPACIGIHMSSKVWDEILISTPIPTRRRCGHLKMEVNTYFKVSLGNKVVLAPQYYKWININEIDTYLFVCFTNTRRYAPVLHGLPTNALPNAYRDDSSLGHGYIMTAS